MPWLIFAVLVWAITLFTVRLQGLGRFWSAFIWSVLVNFYLNQQFVGRGFYQFQETLFTLGDVPLLYLIALGGLAIMIMRFLPDQKIWQLPYLILFGAGLFLFNVFALGKKYILYLQWSCAESFIFTLIALITIVWLSSLTIRQQEKRYYL